MKYGEAAAESREAVEAVRRNVTRMTVKPRALIVDDDDADAYLLQQMIKSYCVPMEAVVVKTVEEAGRLIRENHWDVVFLDLRFPGKSGLDLLSELTDAPPIIVMSGLNDSEPGMKEALRLGACAVFKKPFAEHQMRMICGAMA